MNIWKKEVLLKNKWDFLEKKEKTRDFLIRKFYRIKKSGEFMNRNVGIATGIGIAIIIGVIIFQVNETMWQ